jgi:hypothetical protein
MAHYTKDEAQDWAWKTLKGQCSTLVNPRPQDTGAPHRDIKFPISQDVILRAYDG